MNNLDKSKQKEKEKETDKLEKSGIGGTNTPPEKDEK